MPTSLAPLRPNIESGDRTMPVIKFITVGLPIALGVVMIGTGGLNFAGPPLARENFAHWGYPAGFHRVAGTRCKWPTTASQSSARSKANPAEMRTSTDPSPQP